VLVSTIENGMGICSTIAERVHTRTSQTIRWPWKKSCGDANFPIFEGNSSIGLVEVDIWEDDSAFEHQDAFDDASETRSTF
jgi:hypothetical protein